MTNSKVIFRMCQGFRLTKRDDYLLLIFDHFSASIIFKVPVAIAKIGLSLKPNHLKKFNQVKLVQILDTLSAFPHKWSFLTLISAHAFCVKSCI